jgi:hypothetical protein
MNRAGWFLLVLGLAQIAADLCGFPSVKAIAAATAASPAPKVFCSHHGLETYSTRFFLEWEDLEGESHSLQFSSELNQRLLGPYNRRNVYGAVIAYGPVLASSEHLRPMLESVLRYAWTGTAPLFREIGIDPSTIRGRPRLRLEPIPGTDLGDLPRVLEFPAR